MKAETKYNVNDKVYFIGKDDYICHLIIAYIGIIINNAGKITIRYFDSGHSEHHEDHVYATKDEAKKYLHKKIDAM